jgi:hypothetical protein
MIMDVNSDGEFLHTYIACASSSSLFESLFGISAVELIMMLPNAIVKMIPSFSPFKRKIY